MTADLSPMQQPKLAAPRRWLAVHRRWLAVHRRSVIGGALVLWAAGMVAVIGLIVVYDLDFFGPVGGPWLVSIGSFAIPGAVIGWKRPGHVIALIFLVMGIVTPFANGLMALALGPLAGQPMELRTLLGALSLAATTTLMPLVLLALVLFPNGRLPSRRWRWLPWLVGFAALVGGPAAFAAGGWGGDVNQTWIGPPFGGDLLGIAAVLSPLFFFLLSILMVSSPLALVLRYRSGDAVTRQQLKWLALAALVIMLIVVWTIATERAVATTIGSMSEIVVSLGFAFVPVSVAIAIVRHGLYDIDVVLSRTIVFVTLAAFITGLYAVTVVGIGTLIGDPTNLALTIGTTALVAVLFEPVRARVQQWANRAVYGRRATPYEILTSIVDDLPTGSAAEDQLEGLATLLADGTGAHHATIWVELEGALRAAACAPAHDPSEHAAATYDDGGQIDVAQATHMEPVQRDGDLLGALSFERRRDDPVTPHDRELLAQMAGQASLVLGNARLRERLRDRIEELRASRQRLVAAQDEARRRLERDLHDGAQQQLVALKVKLGLARSIAIKEDAGEQVSDSIGELSSIADAAVADLRDLARGIYPPLLEAEGLERALASQVQRAPVATELQAEGLRRYDRQVEATVYFCVLEAIRNAITHSGAGRLRVQLEDRDDSLGFRVADDGCGFDPNELVHGAGLTNMADRLDALGGSLVIEAGTDGGVELAGSIPVRADAVSNRPEELAGV